MKKASALFIAGGLWLGVACATGVVATSDFTGDGSAGILWRNQNSGGTGENYLYPMNGAQILPSEGFLRTVADLNWRVVGVGDFDGDGKADILWRNVSTGQNYIYCMAGTAIVGEGFIRTVDDQNWQVAGVGDFDGDGKDDILWRHALTGENYLYPMDGVAIKPGEGFLRTVADLNWKIAGVGDFDGDGKADILWRHSTSGQNYLYPMDGTTIKAGEGFLRTVADLNWKIAGVGHFDADNKADIVWRNASTGDNYIYLMDGTAIAGEGFIRTVTDLNWRIVAIGDYDADGKSDLFWRHAVTGETYLYPMDGLVIKASEGFVRTVSDMRWTVVSTPSTGSLPSYSTTFDATESPISEGGAWHRADNTIWTDVNTANGIAFGTNGARDDYDDSYALLSGFGPDQTATAVIARSPDLNADVDHEVELLLRFTDGPTTAQGYECVVNSSGNVQIVRWNGALGDFTVLDTTGPNTVFGDIVNGDVFKATIVGSTISAFINDTLIAQATDTTYTTGQPGIGFFTRPGGSTANFGITSYSVTSN